MCSSTTLLQLQQRHKPGCLTRCSQCPAARKTASSPEAHSRYMLMALNAVPQAVSGIQYVCISMYKHERTQGCKQRGYTAENHTLQLCCGCSSCTLASAQAVNE